MSSKILAILDPIEIRNELQEIDLELDVVELKQNELMIDIGFNEEDAIYIGPQNDHGDLSDCFTVDQWLLSILGPLCTHYQTRHGVSFEIGSAENTHCFFDRDGDEIGIGHPSINLVREFAREIRKCVLDELKKVTPITVEEFLNKNRPKSENDDVKNDNLNETMNSHTEVKSNEEQEKEDRCVV